MKTFSKLPNTMIRIPVTLPHSFQLLKDIQEKSLYSYLFFLNDTNTVLRSILDALIEDTKTLFTKSDSAQFIIRDKLVVEDVTIKDLNGELIYSGSDLSTNLLLFGLNVTISFRAEIKNLGKICFDYQATMRMNSSKDSVLISINKIVINKGIKNYLMNTIVSKIILDTIKLGSMEDTAEYKVNTLLSSTPQDSSVEVFDLFFNTNTINARSLPNNFSYPLENIVKIGSILHQTTYQAQQNIPSWNQTYSPTPEQVPQTLHRWPYGVPSSQAQQQPPIGGFGYPFQPFHTQKGPANVIVVSEPSFSIKMSSPSNTNEVDILQELIKTLYTDFINFITIDIDVHRTVHATDPLIINKQDTLERLTDVKSYNDIYDFIRDITLIHDDFGGEFVKKVLLNDRSNTKDTLLFRVFTQLKDEIPSDFIKDVIYTINKSS